MSIAAKIPILGNILYPDVAFIFVNDNLTEIRRCFVKKMGKAGGMKSYKLLLDNGKSAKISTPEYTLYTKSGKKVFLLKQVGAYDYVPLRLKLEDKKIYYIDEDKKQLIISAVNEINKDYTLMSKLEKFAPLISGFLVFTIFILALIFTYDFVGDQISKSIAASTAGWAKAINATKENNALLRRLIDIMKSK